MKINFLNSFLKLSKILILNPKFNFEFVKFAFIFLKKVIIFTEWFLLQFDALAVDHDCGGDGLFVDVFGIYIFLPLLLVQHNSNSGV